MGPRTLRVRFIWGCKVSKTVAFVLAATGFAASAHAADLSLDSLKDPLPDTLSYAGITFYGTVDLGGAYQEHGYNYSSYWANGLNYQPKPSVPLSGLPSQWLLTNNALSTSTVGVKVEEGLGYGFVFIGRAETGFDPISLNLANGAASLQQNAQQKALGVPLSAQDAFSDSSRDGQFLNGQAYFGLSNASYGTLTFGRQNSFLNDAVSAYDPNGGSIAFSLIGNTGTIVTGAGDTEATRWDNAIKYIYQYGPAHAGVEYSPGSNGTELLGSAYGANAGVTYKGVSVDAYYTKENAAVNLDTANAGPGGAFLNQFNFTVSSNEAWGAAAKYSYDLGGGFKDEPLSRLTIFGGYVHVDSGNPDKTQSDYAGDTTAGGYLLYAATSATAYVTDRIIQTGWLGASYQTGPWTFTGAWYIENQNNFDNIKAGSTKDNLNLGGNLNWVSGVVDYTFNKHFDVYGGVSWVDFTGDWANGYGVTQDVNIAAGVRLKF